MMTSFLSSFDQFNADVTLITTLHKEPFFQPFSPASASASYTNTLSIIYAFITIVSLHLLFLRKFKSNAGKLGLANEKEIMKLSYQATNFTVNLSLGLYGLYTILFLYPTGGSPFQLLHPFNDTNIINRISGYEQYTHFSAYQMGYNLWAIPVGILYVNENKFMIVHHISVICTAFLACYTNLTYRYASVYIFGFAEMSSVPLAIMNYLKDQREWTRNNFELGFGIIKVLFATMFLVLRVIIATPLIYDITRGQFIVNLTLWMIRLNGNNGDLHEYDVGLFKTIFVGFDWILKVCLGFLQVSFMIRVFVLMLIIVFFHLDIQPLLLSIVVLLGFFDSEWIGPHGWWNKTTEEKESVTERAAIILAG